MTKSRVLKIVLFVCVSMLWSPGHAQKELADSLKGLLKSQHSPKKRIDLLHKIVWEEAPTNPKSAIELARESLQLSEGLKDSSRIARSYNRIGLVHDYTGNFELAEKKYLKALKIKSAVDGADATDGLLNNLGSVNYYMGHYEKSMDYYLKSLLIREKKKDVDTKTRLKNISQSYNNIGLLLKSQSNYKGALEYYKKALKIKEELKDFSGATITLSNIGVIYMEQGSMKEAKEVFERAIALSDSLGDLVSQAMLFNNMGLMNTREDKLQLAKGNYLQAISIYDSIDDAYGKSTGLVNLASIEFSINNFAKAREAGRQALSYARNNKFPKVELSSLQVLSEIEAKQHPQLSLDYLKQYITLKDSLQDVMVSSKVSQLAVMYETEQKETEIELLKQDQELIKQENENKDLIISKNRIYFYILIAGILALLFIFYVSILYFRSKRKAAEERANKLHEQHQREIDNLRNSIEPLLESSEQRKLSVKINQSELNKYLLNPLSDRELDVLYLIADGMTNKEIGEQLFISVNTVKTHVLRIYEKLDVQNRTAAAVKANSLQIIQ